MVLQKFQEKEKKIIAFTGLDGSGKTIQAFLLYKELLNKGKKVVYRHLIKESTAHRLMKLPHHLLPPFLKKFIRKLFAFYDLVKFILWLRDKEGIILCDRYFFDILIHIKTLDGDSPLFEKIYCRLIPPAVIFFLNVTPEEAWRRKPEHSLSLLRKKFQYYKILQDKFITLPSDSIENVQRKVREKLSEY